MSYYQWKKKLLERLRNRGARMVICYWLIHFNVPDAILVLINFLIWIVIRGTKRCYDSDTLSLFFFFFLVSSSFSSSASAKRYCRLLGTFMELIKLQQQKDQEMALKNGPSEERLTEGGEGWAREDRNRRRDGRRGRLETDRWKRFLCNGIPSEWI